MSTDDLRPAELFQLDEATCAALLTTQHVGRLVIGGDDPTVVPVNYTFAEGVITLRVLAGSRAEAAAGHEVLFEVDMFDERTRSGWSVIARGPTRAVRDGDEGAPVESWAPGARDRGLLVEVAVMTGRLLRGAVVSPVRGDDGYL